MASTANPNATNHFSIAARKIPIVFVPDALCTRLSEKDGTLVWNPTGSDGKAEGGFVANIDRLRNVDAPLEPDTQNFTGDEATQKIVNYSHVVPDYYDLLLSALDATLDDKLLYKGCQSQVYVSGYDWRLGAARAASQLLTVVTRARNECGGEKALIVSHGQGGQVARLFCRLFAGEAAVRAMFLIGCANLGSPDTYARLKAGIVPADDELFGKLKLLPADARSFLRDLPGMYDSLPNKLLTQQKLTAGKKTALWLTFATADSGWPPVDPAFVPSGQPAPPPSGEGASPSPFQQPLTDCTTGFPAAYLDIYTGFAETSTSRGVRFGHVRSAVGAHDLLTINGKAYVHPCTYSVIGTKVASACLANLSSYGEVRQEGNNYVYAQTADQDLSKLLVVSTGDGDGVVLSASASPMPDLLTTAFTKFAGSKTDSLMSRGVKHRALANDTGVAAAIVNEITIIVQTDLDAGKPPVEDKSPVRLEYRSRYTKQPPPAGREAYTQSEWVPAAELPFLIGTGKDGKLEIEVRVASPPDADQIVWQVHPVGDHSGTIPTKDGTGTTFKFTPEVTVAQRPISGSREPNKPVMYDVTAMVWAKGVQYTKVELIKQDEADLIRQEFLDYRTWKTGFTLDVPIRQNLVDKTQLGLPTNVLLENVVGNYPNLTLNSAFVDIVSTVSAEVTPLGVQINLNSAFRNPRRNTAAGGVTTSNHQHGGAVDMQPALNGEKWWSNRDTPEWRLKLLQIYRAALKLKGGVVSHVILEHFGTALYPRDTDFGDGAEDWVPDETRYLHASLPEAAEYPTTIDGVEIPKSKEHTFIEMFNYATHVHADHSPSGGDVDN